MEAGVDEVIRQIEVAFADVPRPDDEGLLHAQSHDDMDLEDLYPYGHWREVLDDAVVSAYAALAFLSPEGFRHFVPAYLVWVLRHPDSGEAVVDSTIWAFLPEMYTDEIGAYVRSKWTHLDPAQASAVEAFLAAMVPHHPDAERALAQFRDQFPPMPRNAPS